jgi:DNA-directed RNA polymerase subunit RPC12/RpoP
MKEEKLQEKLIEGEDIPFGPPPEEYNYHCSRCGHDMKVNEAIIDVEVAKAWDEGKRDEEFMPLLGCPNCNNETMEFEDD